MNAFVFQMRVWMDVSLRGNHYSQIVRNRAGEVIGLYPLSADRMDVALRGQKKVFVYETADGKKVALLQGEVFHVINLPDASGLVGLNPIEYNRSAIELSMTTEKYETNFFKNGANASGVLKHPMKLSAEAFERLRNSFEERYQGVAKSGKPIILEEGMDYAKLTMSSSDSQLLETRAFQKTEIAAIFGVPPHMIGDMSKSTFNNMEEMSRAFVKYTLRPLAERFESAVQTTLLEDSSDYYARFNFNSLLRGDPKSRAEYYRTMLNIGAIKPNEIRTLEDLDPAGPEADELYMQVNMSTLRRIASGED